MVDSYRQYCRLAKRLPIRWSMPFEFYLALREHMRPPSRVMCLLRKYIIFVLLTEWVYSNLLLWRRIRLLRRHTLGRIPERVCLPYFFDLFSCRCGTNRLFCGYNYFFPRRSGREIYGLCLFWNGLRFLSTIILSITGECIWKIRRIWWQKVVIVIRYIQTHGCVVVRISQRCWSRKRWAWIKEIMWACCVHGFFQCCDCSRFFRPHRSGMNWSCNANICACRTIIFKDCSPNSTWLLYFIFVTCDDLFCVISNFWSKKEGHA